MKIEIDVFNDYSLYDGVATTLDAVADCIGHLELYLRDIKPPSMDKYGSAKLRYVTRLIREMRSCGIDSRDMAFQALVSFNKLVTTLKVVKMMPDDICSTTLVMSPRVFNACASSQSFNFT